MAAEDNRQFAVVTGASSGIGYRAVEAHRVTGIAVTSLMPGPTETEFFERAEMEKAEKHREMAEPGSARED